jgi:hypothetical protein
LAEEYRSFSSSLCNLLHSHVWRVCLVRRILPYRGLVGWSSKWRPAGFSVS